MSCDPHHSPLAAESLSLNDKIVNVKVAVINIHDGVRLCGTITRQYLASVTNSSTGKRSRRWMVDIDDGDRIFKRHASDLGLTRNEQGEWDASNVTIRLDEVSTFKRTTSMVRHHGATGDRRQREDLRDDPPTLTQASWLTEHDAKMRN